MSNEQERLSIQIPPHGWSMTQIETMHLFEITTGAIGESYVRAYAWAPNTIAALKLFGEKNPGFKGSPRCRQLFNADAEPFVTKLSDSGFNDEGV